MAQAFVWTKRCNLKLRDEMIMKFGLTKSIARQRSRNSGQALVEFALVLGMLMVVLCGIMEFGVYGNHVLKLANATREGARAAALGKPTADIKSVVQTFARPMEVSSPSGSVVMEVSSDGGVTYTLLRDNSDGTRNAAEADQYLRVSATATNTPLTALFGSLFARQFSQQVVMRRENVN
jgi:Flp pilus assembly protein TadG